jgi:hypothetical protein
VHDDGVHGRERYEAGESRRVADLPQFLSLKNNRDRTERVELVIRRTTFAAVTLIALLALGNVFGQRPKETKIAADAADLEVFAPTALRGGLYYQGRLTVEPKRDIDKATLVLDSGWTEQMQINTIEPSPVGEASRDGKLTFDFGHLGPDDKLVVYMQFQVNPTNIGRRSQDVELYDDTTFIARADRTVTVFP